MSKLSRTNVFDEKLNKIENLKFLPFIGENFKDEKNKIMVFAHNIPIPSNEFSKEKIEEMKSTHFSSSMGQYLNSKKTWNKSFRNFTKASLGFTGDYNLPLENEELAVIENFISKISHINYIHNPIESNTQTNVNIDANTIDVSNKINTQIIEALEITHILCWGKNVFEYILNLKNIKILEKWNNFSKIDGLVNIKGFGYAKIELNGKKYSILKTFHPSMPSFRPYNKNTHNILSWFYNK